MCFVFAQIPAYTKNVYGFIFLFHVAAASYVDEYCYSDHRNHSQRYGLCQWDYTEAINHSAPIYEFHTILENLW